MRLALRVVWLAMALVAALVLAAQPAGAHATLQATNPSDGGTVQGGPDRIVLFFSEQMAQPATVTVTGPDGRPLAAGNATVEGDTVSLALDVVGADGSYEVEWRAVSADGHPVEGAFTFTATGVETTGDARDSGNADASAGNEGSDSPDDPPAGHEREGAAEDAATPDESGGNAVPIILVVAGVVGLGLGGALLGKRRQVAARAGSDDRP